MIPPSDDESVNINSGMPPDWDHEVDTNCAFGQDLESNLEDEDLFNQVPEVHESFASSAEDYENTNISDMHLPAMLSSQSSSRFCSDEPRWATMRCQLPTSTSRSMVVGVGTH
jgi:hypothetical protein